MVAMELMRRDVPVHDADVVNQLLGILDRAGRGGMVPLHGFSDLSDGARVGQSSEMWTSRFLGEAANPYRAPDVQRSVHHADASGPDVLRHRYSASLPPDGGGPPIRVQIVVEETASYLRIATERPDLDLRRAPASARPAAVGWLVSGLLRLLGTHRGRGGEEVPHRWVFMYTDLDEGARFSTDFAKHILTMWSWADRVDGGVTNGQVWLLCQKRYEAMNGRLVFLDDMHWFDGLCWKGY